MTHSQLEKLVAFIKKRGVEATFTISYLSGTSRLNTKSLRYSGGEHPDIAFLLLNLLEKDGWDTFTWQRRLSGQQHFAVSNSYTDTGWVGEAPTRTEAIVRACLALEESE
jgi:hypothetical protein